MIKLHNEATPHKLYGHVVSHLAGKHSSYRKGSNLELEDRIPGAKEEAYKNNNRMIKKFILIIIILCCKVELIAQSRMDSSRCFTFYDAERRIVLLLDSSNLKDGIKLRYLSEKNELLYTEIYFDSSNKSIKNIGSLKSLFTDANTVKDSVTLLVCLLLDAGKNILESRIIFSNDIACSAAFTRRILYDKYFIRSLDYNNYKVLSQVLIIFKEFTCHTFTTHSTFD